jgi:uncharacterized circularly permuted ATP-grasp superfamily protein/uncharacterized alpha-E superfamily protein
MSLLLRYAPSEARFDEMVDASRAPRAHWRPLLSHLAGLPAEVMRRRSAFVNDAIASDGVSYNVYADPIGTSRSWELDVMPLVLPAEEWRFVAAAVAQRAKLLDAILKDLYGPQTLLAEGLVPPALVFGQRTFLWPAHGIVPPDGVALHIYAADLARSPDGRFWVLADRTRGPAGAGYALQNRMTLARAFPDAFREVQVEHLLPFFSALRDTLTKRAQEHTVGRVSRPRLDDEAPLAVVLTPGPYNETYFEHSFLAKQLGFPLVEGQDLIVRGDKVYLKTLRGLQRVHAILRRLDDDFCDPVELRADSALGVPGLLHVVRARNVIVANALGSGVLETGAFTGFFPAVAERLLGERLLMPSIATWWCGERPALDYVTSHLDELVVKPAYPSIRMAPVLGHTLDAAARAELLERIHKTPHAYVAQEWVRLSQAPTWDATTLGLVPRATTIRVFAVATPDGYEVMPGALARVAPPDGDVASMQWGGSSKDTWVLAEGTHGRSVPHTKRARVTAVDVSRSVVDIPSRVGENLFWMGRYAERCEATARVLRAALVRTADASPDEQAALATLEAVARSLDVTTPPKDSPRRSRGDAFLAAVWDKDYTGGLASNVARLVGCASHVRERLSVDNWHILSKLGARMPAKEPSLGAALSTLDEVMTTCVSLAGFAMDDMTRDESWQFLLMGRRLERLAFLSSTLASVLRLQPNERPEALEWLLEAANSIVTFRARYRRQPELLPVLHLVGFDETNPHAVAFQVRELVSSSLRIVDEIGGDPVGRSLAALGQELRRCPLEGFEPEEGPEVERAAEVLGKLLDRCERAAYDLSDEAHRRFFTHAGTPVPLGIEGS